MDCRWLGAGSALRKRRRDGRQERYRNHSMLSQGKWAKIRVSKSGIHELTPDVVRKAEAEKLKTDLSATDQQLQNLSREISSKYETYLGQHCNTLAVKQLIQIMQSGRASVVSEAITILESANQVDETSLASASAAGIDVTPNVVTGSWEEAPSSEGTSSDEAN